MVVAAVQDGVLCVLQQARGRRQQATPTNHAFVFGGVGVWLGESAYKHTARTDRTRQRTVIQTQATQSFGRKQQAGEREQCYVDSNTRQRSKGTASGCDSPCRVAVARRRRRIVGVGDDACRAARSWNGVAGNVCVRMFCANHAYSSLTLSSEARPGVLARPPMYAPVPNT